MANYQTMYTKLFNAVTDTINILQNAQVETEELFLEQEETKMIVLKNPNDSEV